MSSLRLAFMGSPGFAVPILQALLDAGHEVACVYSQPPRPAGRGHRQQPSPVHAFAAAKGLAVRTPRTLRAVEEQDAFARLAADAVVVAAYGLILPRPVLVAPRLGCFNVHASLLPRWRGAAPIQRAILAGDARSGVTIMQMDEGLDTGPMLMQRSVSLTPETTASRLHDQLAALGAEMMVEALACLTAGTITPQPQPEEGVTYAPKVERHEGRIDWHRPAADLERAVRALDPWPGCWFEHDGQRIKVLTAEVAFGAGEPGLVLDDRLTVACGGGALAPSRLQRAGRSPADVASFLRGHPIPAGTVLA